MPRRKDLPADIVIDRHEIIDDLMRMIKESTDKNLKIPGEKYKIRFNKRSIRMIYGMIEELIANYLNFHSSNINEQYDDDYSGKIVVKPFGFLRLESYDSREREAINHLTGKPYTKPHTRHYFAYISKYWKRMWNKRKAFCFERSKEEKDVWRELWHKAIKEKDPVQLELLKRWWNWEPPSWTLRK